MELIGWRNGSVQFENGLSLKCLEPEDGAMYAVYNAIREESLQAMVKHAVSPSNPLVENLCCQPMYQLLLWKKHTYKTWGESGFYSDTLLAHMAFYEHLQISIKHQ